MSGRAGGSGPVEPGCLHHHFEAQVDRAPEAAALSFRGRHTSYRELEERANRLAGRLRRLGVGPEVPVAVWARRSPETVAALLGILKAGGVCVPLDPAYPLERRSFMLRDSGAAVLVSTGRSPAMDLPRIVRAAGLRRGGEPASRCDGGASPANAAYLVYTSGSTGLPRGVPVLHRGLHAVVAEKVRHYGLLPSSRVLQLLSPAFDASVGEIFMALAAGACLCLAPAGALLPGPPLARLLGREAVTTLVITPSALTALPEAELPALRCIVAGGEPLPAETVARWAPGRRFFNTYGVTESSICSTIHACRPGEDAPAIGTPVAGTRVHLLDAALRPVSAGGTGEICLGGAGLARGYHRRPALTAERFVPAPSGAGERLYRTGDLGRLREDGALVFAGRTDRQVKVRGYRVEPGEVEAALRAHPGVRDAAVTAAADGAGGHLVAHVVAEDPAAWTSAGLDAFLRARLPGHMVPVRYLAIASLPRTPNGKVDLRALSPPPLPRGGESATGLSADGREARLCALFAAVLGRERVGMDDGFFELGGHSLLLAQLAAGVRAEWGVEIPLGRFVQAPTVATLARLLPGGGREAMAACVDWTAEGALDPAIRPTPDAPPRTAAPADVLLTGATGFLGAFLLAELLARTGGRVHCLVRARDRAEGTGRIRSRLGEAGVWRKGDEGRIVAVPGDLAEARLGLGAQEFRRLAASVGSVLHAAGAVDFVRPYRLLRGPNVDGTREVLRLACLAGARPVHFVSTLAVFLTRSRSAADRVGEGDDPGSPEELEDGYAQSKRVAERLVAAACARGLPARIYRPARLGAAAGGAPNPDDLLSRLLRGCVQLGAAPDRDLLLDLAPADFVARAIVHLSGCPASPCQAFHLMNEPRVAWAELVAALGRPGSPVRLLPPEDWRTSLLDALARGADNALAPLLPVLQRERGIPTTSLTPQFECGRTLRRLAAAGIAAPPASLALFTPYLAHAAGADARSAGHSLAAGAHA